MLGSRIIAALLLPLTIAAAAAGAQTQSACSNQPTKTVTVFTSVNDNAARTTTATATSTKTTTTTSRISTSTATTTGGDSGRGGTGSSGPSAPAAGTFRNVVYFTNWGIYGAQHHPQDIQAGLISHLLYSFANISDDGQVVSTDEWADVQLKYPGDVTEPGKNAYGCVKQLYLQKKKNRQLKVLLSIGGWTLSPRFAAPARTAAGRTRFANSAVALMGDYGFDGLDIDWEYPTNPTQAADFVALLAECRRALDEYAAKYNPGYRFSLTIAVPAGSSHYQKLDMRRMIPYVDGWNLMAYDYAGSWDSNSGHQANLFRSTTKPSSTPADTDSALNYYIAQGVDPRKIMLGLPLYGRAFQNTAGIGEPFNGVGSGLREAGIWPYNMLPRAGATERFDQQVGALYSYNPTARELITYDNVQSAQAKAAYLVRRNLGGAVFWESSGDRKGDQSLIGAVSRASGQLDRSQNLLSYPGSKYDNIRNGVPGQ